MNDDAIETELFDEAGELDFLTVRAQLQRTITIETAKKNLKYNKVDLKIYIVFFSEQQLEDPRKSKCIYNADSLLSSNN